MRVQYRQNLPQNQVNSLVKRQIDNLHKLEIADAIKLVKKGIYKF